MKTKITTLLVMGMTMLAAVCQAQNGPAAPLSANYVALKAVGADDSVVPKLSYVETNTTIVDVINDLSVQAGINVQLDPKLTDPADGKALKRLNLTWRNVSACQALAAVLDNNGLTADISNPKVVTIKVKDPTAAVRRDQFIVPLRYANPSNITAIIKATITAPSLVQPDIRANRLVLSVTEPEWINVSNLLVRLDAAVPQILIEAKFCETTKNPKSVKGIDWSGTLAAQNVSFGNGLTGGNTVTKSPGDSTTTTGGSLPSGAAGAATATTPGYSSQTTLNTAVGQGVGGLSMDTARGFFPNTAFLNADGAKAVLSFLNTESDTEFIANPRVVAQDGTATELSAIQNIPVFEEQQGSTQTGIQQANTVKPNYDLKVGQTTLNEVGVKLLVTPRVVGTSDILLDLRPEISAVDGVETKTLGSKVNESPIFRRQRLNTMATVPSGNTLVIGGLVQDTKTKGYTKVPVLGDLPGLGLLFRRDSKERSKRNLLIFVTPTLVTDGDFQPTTSTFLKTKSDSNPDIDETAWDTGAPASKYRPLF